MGRQGGKLRLCVGVESDIRKYNALKAWTREMGQQGPALTPVLP